MPRDSPSRSPSGHVRPRVSQARAARVGTELHRVCSGCVEVVCWARDQGTTRTTMIEASVTGQHCSGVRRVLRRGRGPPERRPGAGGPGGPGRAGVVRRRVCRSRGNVVDMLATRGVTARPWRSPVRRRLPLHRKAEWPDESGTGSPDTRRRRDQDHDGHRRHFLQNSPEQGALLGAWAPHGTGSLAIDLYHHRGPWRGGSAATRGA